MSRPTYLFTTFLVFQAVVFFVASAFVPVDAQLGINAGLGSLLAAPVMAVLEHLP